MNRRDLQLLAFIGLAVAFVAVRIASAQESADVPTSAGGAASPDAVPANGPAVVSHPIATAGRIANDDATVLVLAMAMVLEAGFDAALDHAAIAHVMRRKAADHDVDFTNLLIRYVAGFGVDTPRTRWVLDLRLDAQKPDGWPTNLAWSAHVTRWNATLDRARAFLRGELTDPCRGKAKHWGGDMDNARAAYLGMVPVECGETANTFYAVAAR